jgi:hypothetical protein
VTAQVTNQVTITISNNGAVLSGDGGIVDVNSVGNFSTDRQLAVDSE